jgi:Flp pilus assembly protein TadG
VTRAGEEHGTITLWVLGMCLMMLFIGGISFDLWRAFSERRALAGMADAAAVAGASGLDADHFRSTGEVRLAPDLSEALAWDNLKQQADYRSLADASVAATTTEVTVQAKERVHFTLLRIFLSRTEPFTVTATATAEPRRSR